MSSQSLICPDCGAPMVLRNSCFGKFYGCSRWPVCKATHGAHPNGDPLGIPADHETKQWRIKAHAAFDTLWNKKSSRGRKRGKAYKWMQKAMGLTEAEAHIGRFDIAQCQKLIALVEKRKLAIQRHQAEKEPKS